MPQPRLRRWRAKELNLTGQPQITLTAPDAVSALIQRSPQRRSIVTGQSRAQAEMLRFVIGPEAQLVPDIFGKLPGRGYWLEADRSILERALRRRLFTKKAAKPITIAADLVDLVSDSLARYALDLLGLARRSGAVFTGFHNVRAHQRQGDLAVLVTAFDASANARKKISQNAATYPHIELFASAELDLAFGRENVIHAGMFASGLTDRFVLACLRLAGFRTTATPAKADTGAALSENLRIG